MNLKFNEIDLKKWPRGGMFYYFSKMAPTGYSLTVDIDVTVVKEAMKDRNLKFFPAYLYLVTKCLNKQVEFKVAMQDDKLGYYDTLTPMYGVFHEDDKTISLMWTEYDDDFEKFYNNYIENQNKYKNNHGVLSQPEQLPPANCYTVSCVPWIDFKHFSVNSYENKPYYFPSIESGKIHEQDGRLIMPLSMTLHHATTDGYHVKVFLEDLQDQMNNPQNWLFSF
ncbi:MAG: chloramphenicol acetyltransferase [Intestinibacter sp.]|uniref:chloramphenicol acetyltransferase n=1 Tax=Intestinibacter sp. TaxID=1965304 RepID=UPI0025C4A5FE|nr:chloramphenicol acetyltransferase [Intestinibacter sp.]MCI6738331.1 chloramphenicol acetyltransferase [Intestinibacter sp.]